MRSRSAIAGKIYKNPNFTEEPTGKQHSLIEGLRYVTGKSKCSPAEILWIDESDSDAEILKKLRNKRERKTHL